MAAKIEDYGIVGDMQTAALISRAGSVDWLCAPSFDCDACFAALLGYDRHGRWAIRPTASVRETIARYLGDTLILATEFRCEGGAARVLDFMPTGGGRSDLVRRVEGLGGEVPFEMVLAPRFGYGANVPWVRARPEGTTFTAGPDSLRLVAGIATAVSEHEVRAYFPVREGERVDFQLCWHASHRPPPAPLDVERALARTRDFWEAWVHRCAYRGRWREAVVRSLITLKALTFAATGAVVAAPTTSLPEELGGVRNWDYRVCWLRDATLTLDALLGNGYEDEARAFRDWLLRAAAGDPDEMQIMYDLHGGRRLTELELPWLPGYEGSRPVRVGNAAHEQLQLDVFGEVLASAHLAREHGLPEIEGGWDTLRRLMGHIESIWQEPDNGIWEVRGKRRHFTFSKAMAWVAVDRSMRLVEDFGIGGDAGRALIPRLHGLRERIHEEVVARGFNPHIGAFAQSYGSAALDASLLLLPHEGFIAACDPRMRSTVAAIERGLVEDGLVRRYVCDERVDGLPAGEGAFVAASFWLADNYALDGRRQEAEALFERVLGLRNHLGLLAEEYAPRLERQLGNFPQGFSHLALIGCAQNLEGGLPPCARPRRARHPRAGRARA
jgi:GH15 family glucan-1,4-alpha-glucosidase